MSRISLLNAAGVGTPEPTMVGTMSTSQENSFAPFTTSPEQRRAAFVHKELAENLAKDRNGDAGVQAFSRVLRVDGLSAAAYTVATTARIAEELILKALAMSNQEAIEFLKQHVPTGGTLSDPSTRDAKHASRLMGLLLDGHHVWRPSPCDTFVLLDMTPEEHERTWSMMSFGPYHRPSQEGVSVSCGSPSEELKYLVWIYLRNTLQPNHSLLTAIADRLDKLIASEVGHAEPFYDNCVVAVSDDGRSISAANWVVVFVPGQEIAFTLTQEEAVANKLMLPRSFHQIQDEYKDPATPDRDTVLRQGTRMTRLCVAHNEDAYGVIKVTDGRNKDNDKKILVLPVSCCPKALTDQFGLRHHMRY